METHDHCPVHRRRHMDADDDFQYMTKFHQIIGIGKIRHRGIAGIPTAEAELTCRLQFIVGAAEAQRRRSQTTRWTTTLGRKYYRPRCSRSPGAQAQVLPKLQACDMERTATRMKEQRQQGGRGRGRPCGGGRQGREPLSSTLGGAMLLTWKKAWRRRGSAESQGQPPRPPGSPKEG